MRAAGGPGRVCSAAPAAVRPRHVMLRFPTVVPLIACALLLGACDGKPREDAVSSTPGQGLPAADPRTDAVASTSSGPVLREAEVRAFYAPLDTLEGSLDPERACGMLARDFEGRFDTRHPDGSTTQRVVGRDQTCADARAGALALRGTLAKGPAPENSFDVQRVIVAADGQSAQAQYAQHFELPGKLVIELRGTDTIIREDGRLAIHRSVGRESIRNP